MNFTEHIKFAYSQGGIPVFQWYPKNPYNDGDATDLDGWPCTKILSDTDSKPYQRYIAMLDVIAKNIASYKDKEGNAIPIVFRLLEDGNTDTYWWGTGSNSNGDITCSANQYKELWTFTRDYLNKVHAQHNILWEYQPYDPSKNYESAFVDRYPGNEYVDIVSASYFAKEEDEYADGVLSECRVVANFSATNGKISGLSKTGLIKGMKDATDSLWYYKEFGETLMNDDLCHKISYAMTDSNTSPKTYSVPLEDETTYKGFKKLIKSGLVLFADAPVAPS